MILNLLSLWLTLFLFFAIMYIMEVSVVHGPARLESPGSGSAFKGSGLENFKAGPSVGAQARPGPAQSSGRGLG